MILAAARLRRRFAPGRFFVLNFETFKLARDGAGQRVVAHGKRMDTLVGRDLLGEVLDLESDHLRDGRLATAAKFIHIGHNDRMECFTGWSATIVRHTEDAQLFNK